MSNRLVQWVKSVYRERKIWASERSRFLDEAKVKEQQGLFTHGNLNDYIQALQCIKDLEHQNKKRDQDK